MITVVENRVTLDNGYSFCIEKRLAKKLNRMAKMITQAKPKLDSLLINEGKEGRGKTNSSVVEAAFMKGLTGREVQLFFHIEPLMKYAQATHDKIIIWDEPALDSFSSDQVNNLNKDMQRLFAVIRKKRHFFIVNYTKFWKFPEAIVVDRADGLVHMQESDIGRFLYVRKKNLEKLWDNFKNHHLRLYKKLSSFGGDMPDIMEKNFDILDFSVNGIPHSTHKTYDIEKDKAIMSVGQRKSKAEIKALSELRELKGKIGSLDVRTLNSKEELARALGLSVRTIQFWHNSLGKVGFEGEEQNTLVNNLGLEGEKSSIDGEEEPKTDENDELEASEEPDDEDSI